MKTFRLALLPTLLLTFSFCGFSQVTLVEYTFTGEVSSAATVQPNVTASDLTASSGNITFGTTTGGWSGSGVPYAQAASGWNEAASSTAKILSFTVTADPFSLINTNNLSFLYRATGVGPDSISVIVNSDTLLYDAFSANTTIPFSEPVTLTNQETVEVKILGWGDTGSGGGDLRIDDIELTGSITEKPQVIHFDDVNLWNLDGAGYSSNHEYNESGVLFTGGPALRQGPTNQDGFDATFNNSAYAWRLQDASNVNWTATLNLEGTVLSFGFNVRRWDASPSPDYDVSYTTDGGNSYTSVGTINNAFLNNSSDWNSFSYTLPTPEDVDAGDFIVKIEANSTGERIMIDDFQYTFKPAIKGWRISGIDQLFSIDFDQTVPGVNNSTYAASGFSATPISGELNSGAWSQTGMSDGDIAFNSSKSGGDFSRGIDNGTTGTGGNWAFTVSPGNRALGIKPSASDWNSGTLTLKAINQTGQTVNNVELSYLLYIFNNENRSSSFDFQYSTDGNNYTAISLQAFTSVEAQASSPQWRKNKRQIILSGLNWQEDEPLYLRWTGSDVAGLGGRDAFALDDIELVAAPSNTNISGLTANEYESAVVSKSQTLTGNLDLTRYLRTASGTNLEVPSGNYLHITGAIENNGTITVKNNGSLSQEGGSDQNQNNGNYIIEREGTTNTMAYNGWSSPVENVWLHDNSGVFSDANACDLFAFDAGSQTWKYDFPTSYSPDCGSGPVNFTSNVVISGANGRANTGRGYFVPGGGPATRSFTGQNIHNGNISVSAQSGTGSSSSNWTGDDWNLIGNPYPSSLNISSFISANAAALANNSIYVWDDDQSGTPGASTDYIAVNAIGSTGSTGGSNNSITDYLASCQGFFVQTNGAQTLNFTNAMREKGNNTQFRSDDEKPARFWLQLSHDSATSNMLFGVINDATLHFDKKYDAPKRYAQQNLNLAAQLPAGEEMMIMGIPEPLFEMPFTIPLTVQSNTPGEISFSIPQNELYNDQLNLALIDRLHNDTTSILQENYSTTLDAAGKDTSRFELLFFIKESLQDTGTSVHTVQQNTGIKIYAAQNKIILESPGNPITSITIANASGKIVWSEPNNGQEKARVPANGWPAGIYIVRSTTGDGTLSTRKLFLSNL